MAQPSTAANDAITLAAGPVNTEQALALFDRLEPVDLVFMEGAWQGEGYPTGHPLDGVLEAYHWHGKRFDSPECVHPLVFTNRRGGTTLVNPWAMGLALALLERLPLLKSTVAGDLFQWLLPLFSTRRSGARLRLIRYRGQVSATMIYDTLPINDVFRKVDENTVMGIMDLKGAERPFFFVLRREPGGTGPTAVAGQP